MAILRHLPYTQVLRSCTARYQWSGSTGHYSSHEITVISGVLVVYAERYRDNHGPYTRLMCITTN